MIYRTSVIDFYRSAVNFFSPVQPRSMVTGIKPLGYIIIDWQNSMLPLSSAPITSGPGFYARCFLFHPVEQVPLTFVVIVVTTCLLGTSMGVNPGGDGGIYPPLFLGRGDGECFHPPLEITEIVAQLI